MSPTGATDDTVVHGTAIAAGERAVLLRGPSGSGKSDLALRAIAGGAQLATDAFQLVADDQSVIERHGAELTVRPHPRLAGLIEVRGVGIVQMAHVAAARLVLVADLDPTGAVERLPDPWPRVDILGVSLPLLRIRPFEASAPLKLALALAQEPWACATD